METKKELDFYLSVIGDNRKQQAEYLERTLQEHFDFDRMYCIETGASQNLKDGCFGLYLAKICQSTGGTFDSVDLYEPIVDKSRELYSRIIPDYIMTHHVSDSVSFLKEYQGYVNFVHLDSWDLDVKNPVPSMLHGWLEFEAIKDKMSSGSMIAVDDNFIKGTTVYWNNYVDGRFVGQDEIPVTYDIIGKGAMIYHWCQLDHTDWDLVGGPLLVGMNNKLIIKKR